MATLDKHAPLEGVHCAITLRVRPGRESEFEEVLGRFVQRSLAYPGVEGVHLIRPAPGSTDREYGILRSFASEADSREFYGSEMFQQYKNETLDLVDGEAVIRRLHGLEAFFKGGTQAPPRWKMACVTWLGVYPAVLFWSWLIGGRMALLHPLAATAVMTGCMVVTLAWVVMPFLTRLLRPWLHKA
ncbi:antibiotic biosynthesis monooxygenase [Lignipirellula cremea]|uniref:Antibiotic biosynthesis monooxygenase n=1 Tax=Lignipirellula cremea TaxID=2528010 RepID=A0A518DXR4_9BACT|nr:antibiotic biosynthesis monooxygenase [Lignipirellula cremea]QDU96630.1 Antibiotic biosynthesis monooxygenase [Lignipirellula cremea]